MREDRQFWLERLGRYRRCTSSGTPRLWLHASSVGEVTGAMATVFEIRERLPRSAIVLTVGTLQGFRFARKQLERWVDVFALPLDLPWVVRAAMGHFRPDLYVGFESEYWPCLFWLLRRRRVPAVLLNGRLSKRSARVYRRFSPVFSPLFRHFSRVAMNTDDDVENARSLGVPAARIRMLGSSKYDTLAVRAKLGNSFDWNAVVRRSSSGPVIIGGSLRQRECLWLLDTFLALSDEVPDLLGIFAPRHLHRIEEMARYLDRKITGYHLLSRLLDGTEVRREAVVLVDQIGVLFELYALGDLIFCGGTLEPIGGHNIMEPAAWGKRVHYGPHVEKVAREHQVLQSHHASVMVNDSLDLTRLWSKQVKRAGGCPGDENGPRKALRELGGVAPAQADLILEALQTRSASPSNTAIRSRARPCEKSDKSVR